MQDKEFEIFSPENVKRMLESGAAGALAGGVFGAFVVGLLMGCFRTAEALLAPPVTLLAKIPPTAALAVFFVLTRTESQMYVAMIAFGVQSSMRTASSFAAKPPNTTEWIAPSRAQASIASSASGIIGM